MKKNILLFTTLLVLTLTFTECKPQEEKTKNYYGVQSEEIKASKEAYYAFFGTIGALAVIIAIGIKKLKKK